MRTLAGGACCALSGYLAFEVVAHLTDYATALFTFLSLGLFIAGIGIWSGGKQ